MLTRKAKRTVNLKSRGKAPAQKRSAQGKSDARLVLVTFFLALACTFSIINPITLKYSPIVWLLTNVVPLSVAIVMWILPFFMKYGINVNDASVKRSKQKRKVFIRERKRCEKISLRVFYKPTLNGTLWMIRNVDNYQWQDVRIFIERKVNGKKVTEKHELGVVPKGKELKLPSDLIATPGAQWRVMVATPTTYKIEFPDRLRERAY